MIREVYTLRWSILPHPTPHTMPLDLSRASSGRYCAGTCRQNHNRSALARLSLKGSEDNKNPPKNLRFWGANRPPNRIKPSQKCPGRCPQTGTKRFRSISTRFLYFDSSAELFGGQGGTGGGHYEAYACKPCREKIRHKRLCDSMSPSF